MIQQKVFLFNEKGYNVPVMAAFIYIITGLVSGFLFIRHFFKGLFRNGIRDIKGGKAILPSALLVYPLALVSFVVLTSWPAYILAYILRGTGDGIFYGEVTVFFLELLFIIFEFYRDAEGILKDLKNSVKGFRPADIMIITAVAFLGTYLMRKVFFVEDGRYHVGLSVFGDFSTHLDMIRSFSGGNNFPTSYSHFAGEDIRYHFMNQFFNGCLERLGMRLDIAFNLTGAVFYTCMCILIYVLAAMLTGKRSTAFIAVILSQFRSSFSVFINAAENGGMEWLRENKEFTGSTPNENWGLYSLNVFANQRHLAFGMCVLLISLIFFASDVKAERSLKEFFIGEHPGDGKKEALFIRLLNSSAWKPVRWRQCIVLGLIMGLSGFFNGAALIAALIVLFVMAVFSERRLEYLISAAMAVALSSLQTHVFINGSVMEFNFMPGYLASPADISGIIAFIIKCFGLLPFVLLAESCFVDKRGRLYMLAFLAPALFAFLFHTTVDVNVNHKYVLTSQMLLSIYAASFLTRLKGNRDIWRGLTMAVLAFMLVVNGVYDFRCIVKSNGTETDFMFDTDSELTKWVMDNSDCSDIFLTDPYSINEITMGGAMLYYGWPYFAWSAGYDTWSREEKAGEMFSCREPERLKKLCSDENIRYIVYDAAIRSSTFFECNEETAMQTFACVYTRGEGHDAVHIYDTALPLR